MLTCRFILIETTDIEGGDDPALLGSILVQGGVAHVQPELWYSQRWSVEWTVVIGCGLKLSEHISALTL